MMPAGESPAKAAVKLLARRSYGSEELVAALRKRGHGVQAARRTVDRLVELKLLSDRGHAESRLASLLRRTSGSDEFLLETLTRRGVEKKSAGEALAASGLGGELDRAVAMVRGKVRPGVKPDPRKLYAMLARKGFDEETCERALRRVLGARMDMEESSS